MHCASRSPTYTSPLTSPPILGARAARPLLNTALKCIETAKIRFPKRGEEYTKLLRAATKENIPLSTDGMIEELYDQRRKDHISHFILRLAYCKSEELRRWFLTHECELFRYRFELEKNETILKFLKENNMEYHPIDRETKMELAPKLVACGFRLNHDDVMATDYFKVDFEQAVELVKQRKVYLQKGSAYIPKSEILTIIVGAFRAKLSAALTVSCFPPNPAPFSPPLLPPPPLLSSSIAGLFLSPIV